MYWRQVHVVFSLTPAGHRGVRMSMRLYDAGHRRVRASRIHVRTPLIAGQFQHSHQR